MFWPGNDLVVHSIPNWPDNMNDEKKFLTLVTPKTTVTTMDHF